MTHDRVACCGKGGGWWSLAVRYYVAQQKKWWLWEVGPEEGKAVGVVVGWC